jgi:hypothetical protein
MISIRKREGSRNYFPEPLGQNHHRSERVAVVRRLGPRWVTAGRRPRAIPVFSIRRTTLPVPPASAPSSFDRGAGNTGAVIPGAAQ